MRDEEATRRRFEQLFDAHRRAVLGYALRRCSEPADAADVLAETFLVAWRRIDDVPAGEHDERVRGYSASRAGCLPTRVAVRSAARGCRRASAANSRRSGAAPDELAGAGDGVVAEALARLDPHDRELLELTSWEGLDPAQIAAALGAPAATVRSRLHRARARLRRARRARHDRPHDGGDQMSPTIDELVAQGAPISDDELRALATLDDLEAELCAAIMRAPRAAVAKTPPRRRAPWLAGRRLRVAGAVAAVVCAALVLAATSFLGTDPGTQRAWAAEAVRVANAVPRLLIDAPGWKVVRADEFSVDFGEMTFANGERRFDLKWNRTRPGDVLARARDNDPSARVVQTTQVLGHRARVYRYSTNGSGGYLTGVWTQAGYGLELRAASPASEASSVEELVALVHRLRAASVEDWLSAMPASVVLPADREKAVRAMLADIPVPAGFDVDRLTSGDSVRDRYQLGARVAEAAACAWIRRWVGARDRGDEAGKDQAFGALRSSRDWAILREMQVEGDYPEVLWARVDSIVVARAGAREPLDMQRAGADELGCGTLE